MAYDMNPPVTAVIECFDWGRDVYGNPTCHYRISWDNGKTGAEYEGGHYRSTRREQTGYSDKASEAAMYTLRQLFPRTAWKIDPDGIDGGRATGSATFTASRDYGRDTRPATVEESAPLARELESLGYVLEARKRWTPEFDAIRFNALNA